jgi:hypothetical protein
VTRRVDQGNVAAGSTESNLARVDRDSLIAFGLQTIEQEGKLERHSPLRTHCFQGFDLRSTDAASLLQEPSDQGRFAVIDVANDDNTKQRLGTRIDDRCEILLMRSHGDHPSGNSEIPGDAKALERVFSLVIHRPAGAFGNIGHAEFG